MGGYEIYRRLQENETEWEPALCETGIPEDAGYEWVGAVDDLEEVGWMDGSGLSFGVTYCYRVVTRYGDGALSLASDEACGRIRKDVPVMTRASVVATGPAGAVLVGWSPPSELDSLAFPGPYTYELWGRPMDGSGTPSDLVWTSESGVDPPIGHPVVLNEVDTETLAWSYDISF